MIGKLTEEKVREERKLLKKQHALSIKRQGGKADTSVVQFDEDARDNLIWEKINEIIDHLNEKEK